jgi:hypothetical protein
MLMWSSGWPLGRILHEDRVNHDAVHDTILLVVVAAWPMLSVELKTPNPLGALDSFDGAHSLVPIATLPLQFQTMPG